jgi:hypothetical protein
MKNPKIKHRMKHEIDSINKIYIQEFSRNIWKKN